MAEPKGGNGDSGSNDRATVALVASEVREVKAIITGHAQTTAVSLEAIRDKIAPLADLPDRMTKLEGRMDNVEERAKDAQARRLQLPTIVFAGVGAVGVILTIVTQLHP